MRRTKGAARSAGVLRSLGVSKIVAASSHVAGVPERIAPWLRPDTEAMWLAADADPMREASRRRLEDVHLVVVTARHPQLLPVGGNVPHVRTSAASDRPRRDDATRNRIDDAD